MKPIDFMSDKLSVPELTMRGMLLGMLITVIFTASNVYLGLKVGLTFSSSIPAAVISMAILKMFKDSNVLENNMVQTQASAAGTLSAVIFIIPGLLMLGYWQGFAFWQTLMICACGGSLGVLFTIPLRRAMIVNSDLPYPEGLAAAEILKVGSGSTDGSKNNGVKDIMSGGFVAALVSLCADGFQVISSGVHYWFTFGGMTSQLPLGFSSALLGAGYLIGIASGISILVGTLLSWGVFVPYLTAGLSPAEGQSLGAFATGIWAQKVRLIGAGTIGIAAVWTLLTLVKPILEGMRISVQAMSRSGQGKGLHRMDTDLAPKTTGLILGVIILGLVATFYSFIADANLTAGVTWVFIIAGVLVAVCMGFFVAAACGYMAGLIGTSASPISGIGILGIIISSLVVLGIGSAVSLFDTAAGTKFAIALAIFMTSVIVSIAAISNDNLQDLKTGQLVGATPWRQQVALLLGCIVGAFAIAPVLNLLYEAYGFVGAMPRPGMDEAQVLSAPQATLMTTIAKGIFSHNLDWNYILFGVGVGLVIIFIDIVLKKSSAAKYCLPPLAVGMGIYLPPTLEVPLVFGAVISYLVCRYLRKRAEERSPGHVEDDVETCNRHGVLFASGLIVGESLMGVIIAIIIVFSVTSGGSDAPLKLVGKDFGATADWLGLAVFAAVIVTFVSRVLSVQYKARSK